MQARKRLFLGAFVFYIGTFEDTLFLAKEKTLENCLLLRAFQLLLKTANHAELEFRGILLDL